MTIRAESIRFTPVQGSMGARIAQVPAFPDETFQLNIPEAIGDAARTIWQGAVRPEWTRGDEEWWSSTARLEGELSYRVEVQPTEDTLTIRITLKNESPRTWKQSLAFTCFNCGSSPSIHDRECTRHWCRTGGEFRRLIEVPRVCGPRPTIQLYSVEGAPRGETIPFVANFRATPDVVLEGWLAVVARGAPDASGKRSRDGDRLVAVVSKPALYLFQNMEYSCIHSGPGFGALEPGETGESITRIYLVEAKLEDWYERMKREWAAM
jgi:hypothetical protein